METNQLKNMTQEEVKRLFDYSPDTGILEWKKYRRAVTCKNRGGYVVVNISGKVHYVHRLVWLWVYGETVSYLDHIDRNRANNKISNLRPATIRQNSGNQMKREGRASKWRGVTWFRRDQCWRAQIQKHGRNFHLGYFPEEADAAMAYNLAASDYFGEYANLNSAIDPGLM